MNSGKISIVDLEVFYRVGVPDAERAQPQRELLAVRLDRRTPTAFRPSAQGCEARATLGNRRRKITTPTGLWPVPNLPQPRWGWVKIIRHKPRVASQTRQPWAEGHNPVGIENQPTRPILREFPANNGNDFLTASWYKTSLS